MDSTSAKAPAKKSTTRKPAKRKSVKAVSSFDPPQQPHWHQMIAEAAYYRAEKRGFAGDQALEDWLAAEQEIRHIISP